MKTVLIADDEKLIREDLKHLLSQIPDMRLVGEAASGNDALELANKLEPDVLILDIDMPGLSGIEVAFALKDFSQKRPQVIFCTAYDEYAVKAFEAEALDYIVKPCALERLEKALARTSKVNSVDKLADAQGPLFAKKLMQKVVCLTANRRTKVLFSPEEIEYFYANNTEVFAQVKGKAYALRLTLKELNQGLPDYFVQCHKAYILNLKNVEKITPQAWGAYEALLKQGIVLPVSRRYASRMTQALKTF